MCLATLVLAAVVGACNEGEPRSSVPSPSPTLAATATAAALRTPTPEATSSATPAPSTAVPATPSTPAPAPTLPIRTPGTAPGSPPVVTSTRVPPVLPPDTPVSSTPTPPVSAPTPTPRIEVPRTSPPPLAPSQRRELAPIERLEVRVTPSEVVVDVTTGLPSGCAVFDYVGIERSGTTVTLTLWNTFPADPQVACTAIYGFMPHAVPLGPFAPGQYTLIVHNETRTFAVP